MIKDMRALYGRFGRFNRRKGFFSIALAILSAAAGPSLAAPADPVASVGVFEGLAVSERGVEPPLEAVCDELYARGLRCEIVGPDELIAGKGLAGKERFGLLVIPRCDVFPVRAVAPLLKYLESGGRMILIGDRPFSRLAVKYGGEWLTPDEIAERISATRPHKLIVSFSDGELRKWHRSSGSSSHPTRASVEESGRPDIGPALRVDVAGFKTWDVFSRRFDSARTDDPRALTCFWARGSKNLSQLSVEWQEKDGSRWIAVIPLSAKWKHYVLPPERFKYWYDNPSKGRGGPGDRLDPRNARRLAIGLAKSHTPYVPEGDHTFWVADIGWARNRFPDVSIKPPHLEILSPWYKTYITDRVAELRPAPEQVLLDGGPWSAPSRIVSPVARSTGAGFAPSRLYRWIPLVAAFGGNGRERGTAASILVWRGGRWSRSAWGYIGIPDDEYLRKHRDDVLEWIGAMASFLARGVFLGQGGAEHCCYFTGEDWKLRAEVVNRSGEPLECVLTIGARTAGGLEGESESLAVLTRNETRVVLAPGRSFDAATTLPASDFPPGLYWVDVELSSGTRPIDRIHQVVRVVEAERRLDPERLVRVEGGDFVVGGRPWVPFGVNFWPLSVAGLEPSEYRLPWLSPRFYDPERTQRDLERVRDFGMNVVCIQYLSESQARSLIDFLERCRSLGLRAFIFLQGGNPLNPNPPLLQRLIRAAHLAENDAVFAYDIAWEPRVGREAERRCYDPQWRDWIVERYGSIENAEKDWGVRATRDDKGRITGPSRDQILKDGPHRVMVAAYRRFLDDFISQGYGRVVRAIREADPYHLIGARSGYGGNGSAWADDQIPFDLASGAKHLDFISPEGYGHGPSWETVRTAGLTTLYARMVSGGKPVWWAEYGMSVHPQPNDDLLAKQGEMYENFARMFVESHANGGAGWWFPGGYRVEEQSDFGIFNPDGTARPAALAELRWAKSVAAIRAPQGEADIVIEVDRDLHPRGYSQICARHEKEYVEAMLEGDSVALATEATGTNSADVPLVAVGNRPYNGHNPPKYLNAEFERFWVKVGDGEWREVENGAHLAVARGAQIVARAEVANTGQAAWLPPGDPRAASGGAIYLVSTRKSDLPVRAPLRVEVPPLSDASFEDFAIASDFVKSAHVEIEVEAAGRARFGQHFHLYLSVR